MINKTILQGRLTAHPELKHTQSGKPVMSFTLASDRSYKQENGPSADFIRCVAWNKTAEFISQYFTKGQEIIVVGAIQTRTYEQNGVKKYETEVMVAEASFCGPKQSPAGQQTPSYSEAGDFEPIDNDDDLPF